jgi:bacteriocin-like protein
MTKANSERNDASSELSIDEMNQVSGGAIEIREIVIKAVVVQNPTPPAPTPVPYPNLKVRF